MEDLIPAVDRQLLKQELSSERFVRDTNYGDNKIFIVNAHNAPNVMQELGRLREYSFRAAGGGTGKGVDIDKYDVAEVPYEQLVVWNPENEEVVGGYRFMFGDKAVKDENGIYQFGTSGLFNLSEKFINEYLPYTIELGRSFVQPAYQPSKDSRKGIYSLDNLWDGLGALIVDYPQMKYFFGKVTMYPHYDVKGRNMILYFMNKYFGDKDKMVTPIIPHITYTEQDKFDEVFVGGSYENDYKILVTKIRELNTNIPPLVNAYMNLSPTMKTFGTAINTAFGIVEETGILIAIDDIYAQKKERHVETYKKK